MKLSVKELKKFKANSAFIKSNNVVDITSFLKFENNTVTKHSFHAFCVQDIKCSENCLIDEKILFQFVDKCEGEEISVKVEPGKITLSDKHTKIPCRGGDMALFPPNSFTDEGQKELPDKCMWSIKSALQFIHSDATHPMHYIYVGHHLVAANNGTILYTNRIDEDVPDILLAKDVAIPISRFDSILHSQNAKYNFFETSDGLKYGFIKPEFSFWDMTNQSKIPEGLPKIIVDKRAIVNFNDLCINCTSLTLPEVKASPAKRNLALQMEDGQYEVYPSTIVLAQADQFQPFSYLPAQMNSLLKSIDEESITMYRDDVKHMTYVTAESGFVTLIMDLMPKTQN